jgi:hypothetical protein
MSDPNTNPTTVTLDRAQRQAVRGDIRTTAGDLNDLNLASTRPTASSSPAKRASSSAWSPRST